MMFQDLQLEVLPLHTALGLGMGAEHLECGATQGALGTWAYRGLGQHSGLHGLLLGVDHLLALHIFGLVSLQPLHGAESFGVGFGLPAEVVWPFVQDAQGHSGREGACGADRLHHATCL